MDLSILLAAILVVITAGVAVYVRGRDTHRRHRELVQLRLIELFGPTVARVQAEPPELVAWAQVARTARTLFPDAFVALDAGAQGAFPFSAQLVEGVHARWTSQWLAWERDHDLVYKRRASETERELAAASGDDAMTVRARLAEIEQEKLQRYQERYEQYVRVGKALGDLHESGRPGR